MEIKMVCHLLFGLFVEFNKSSFYTNRSVLSWKQSRTISSEMYTVPYINTYITSWRFVKSRHVDSQVEIFVLIITTSFSLCLSVCIALVKVTVQGIDGCLLYYTLTMVCSMLLQDHGTDRLTKYFKHGSKYLI